MDHKKKQVGLLTWHYYQNFGSALQAYALQTAIERCGHSCEVINYRNPQFGEEENYKTKLRYCLSKISEAIPQLKNRFYSPFLAFQRDHLNESKRYYKEDDIITISYDTVVCGSDQIWAPNVFNPLYMLSFVPDNICKISYAASIGLNEIPSAYVDQYRKNLSRFAKISVREDQGRQLLERACSIVSDVVLDPTLLLCRYDYEKLEKKVEVEDKYVFCYFLNPNHEYSKSVQLYADTKGYKVVGFSANELDKEWMDNKIDNIGPREFLWRIHNAETVFTDSYHGTIFSLIYNKEFWTFERFSSDDPVCQNSRIYQLALYFDIGNRIVKASDELNYKTEIAYDDFQSAVTSLKEKSYRYLQEGLDQC